MILALYIILGLVLGGIMVGVTGFFLIMLVQSQWSLPNSQKRRVQQAKIQRDIAKFNAEAEEQRMLAATYQNRRDFEREQTEVNIAIMRDTEFQRALGSGEKPAAKPVQATTDGVPIHPEGLRMAPKRR